MATVEVPETRYARNGPVSIAYQVVGDGPIDVLFVGTGINHLDYQWQFAPYAHIYQRLAAFSRLILYDKRGCGLSDRTVEPPLIDEDVADAITVLDELGISAVHLFGFGEGGAIALALAATRPDRVTSIAVYDAPCCVVAADDFAWGLDPEEAERFVSTAESAFGGTGLLRLAAPNYADDPQVARWYTAQNRAAVSPAGYVAWARSVMELDIRPILTDVVSPVLVLNRTDARMVHPGQARYLAGHLPNARHVDFPGEDAELWAGDTDAVLDEVEEFFTDIRPQRAPTRALATVMFTDIVDSTRQAAELGDTAWREVLARHDDRTRHHVETHDGRVVKSTGDGALATFDTPRQAIAAARDLTADLNGSGVALRVGIHMGEVEILGDDVAGVGVHLAARISALAQPGEVLVSRTVRDLLLGSDITFTDRGTHDLKGVPGTWEILAVVDDAPP